MSFVGAIIRPPSRFGRDIRMKIGLLGQFGSGNSGNDGSLEAMLGFLRRARPRAELMCICSNPAKVREDFGLDVVSLRGRSLDDGAATPSAAGLLRFPARIAGMIAIFRKLAGIDLMIIPGTGILDDFQETPFGWPFILFWWCLAARMRGAAVAFVSIGAGPIRNDLSRRFLKAAVAMAQYRSYRDDFSLLYVRDMGVVVSGDRCVPDLAFGLPDPLPPSISSQAPAHAAIGLGVMTYRGWKRDQADGDAIYHGYIGKLAAIASHLLASGHSLRLFMGDKADETALDDLCARLADCDQARISVARTVSLRQVMEETAKVDLAIVSRYHNLLCALKTGRPTVSLGYSEKNDEMMAEFGRSAFCQHIEDFEVETVLDQVRDVLADLEPARVEIEWRNASIRQELAWQEDLLLSGVLGERRRRRPTT